MRKHMSSPGFVVMEANYAVANWTFRIQGVKPPSSQQLYEFDEPYGQTHASHSQRLEQSVIRAQLCARIMAPEKSRRDNEFRAISQSAEPRRRQSP
jgi:hypothetical protein